MGKMVLYLVTYMVVGLAAAATAYVQDVYPVDQAAGFLSRAQSAGHAEEMVSYISQALPLIPPSGNPVWILLTKRTDLSLIRGDINSIMERLKAVYTTPRDSAAYAQTLNDIRGKLEVLRGQLYEAMPYLLVKQVNVGAAVAYFAAPYMLWRLRARRRVR